MAKSKKTSSSIERAFNELNELVSDTFDEAASQQASAEKGASRIRGGKQRHAVTKKVGAARIREGQQRQAATKNAVRGRRGNMS